ncbi:MAG TPA: TIGR00730 family Rossman fold protein, partial [Blastocatellia bacterium]|nr:TIGR00730 family Rossman fold protein [Blastocatellia bacterium]
YGGANVGLMGVVANAMQELGGEVIGVMPQALVDKEVANTHLSDLRIVGSMHERKAHMAELADAFIALPGGLGTMEEFFEVVTWAQLGMHEKPSGLLNIAGYYDALIQFLDHAVAERLVRQEHRDTIFVDDSAEGLLAQFETYCPPVVGKWLDR